MNIDIQTTTIKLSKSVINQMVQASPHTIADWQVLGYVVNIVNNCSKALIIKRGDNYYTFPCDWKQGGYGIYRRLPKNYTATREFSSIESCNEFWARYKAILESAKQIYI